MSAQRQVVRILLLGDDGVGKTSLIIGLATEESPTDVPPRAHDLYITGELTNQTIPALISDTCSAEQNENEIELEIAEADVVCVVYSLADSNSRTRVSEHWLPLVNRVSFDSYKPVVLVGNKCDFSGFSEDEFDILYLREQYPQVEGCFRASALDLINIVEVFQFAQKTVLHPLRPLIDLETRELSPAFERALRRIFRIFDFDNDGVITCQEMLDFQKTVFKNLLYRQTLQELRETISQNIPEGLAPEGFTLAGFIFIHKLFILRGMRDSVWKVLNTFGYDLTLGYDQNYLVPYFTLNAGEYVELNVSGIEFLSNIFHLFDKDADGVLSPDELSTVFSDFPANHLHANHDFSSTESQRFSLEQFLCLFIHTTHKSPIDTLSALSILGYNKGEWHSSLSALQTTLTQFWHHQDSGVRTTYVCAVFGHYDAGKSSFIKAILGNGPEHFYVSDSSVLVTAISVFALRKNSFVIFEEVPWHLAQEHAESRQFDLAILLFDSSEPSSFEFCREIHTHISRKTPCMFLGTKKDLSIVKQISDVDPDFYCKNFSYFPLMFCSKSENAFFSDLFGQIARFLCFGRQNMRKTSFCTAGLALILAALAVASLTSLALVKIRH